MRPDEIPRYPRSRIGFAAARNDVQFTTLANAFKMK
jgi:hypothetical protein